MRGVEKTFSRYRLDPPKPPLETEKKKQQKERKCKKGSKHSSGENERGTPHGVVNGLLPIVGREREDTAREGNKRPASARRFVGCVGGAERSEVQLVQ